MWFIEITNVPDKVFDLSQVSSSPTQRAILRARSRHLVAIGEGRKLMFVLGVLPPTSLSLVAGLWFIFVKGAQPSLTQLRQMRRVFRGWWHLLGYEHLYADVAPGRDTRFAEFFGATQFAPNTVEWS